MRDVRYFFLGLMIFLSACSDHLTLTSTRWSQNGVAPTKPKELNLKKSSLSLGAQQLIFQPQTIEGIEVEGTYYKEIVSTRPEFVASRWASKVPTALRGKILRMKMVQSRVRAKFLKQHPEVNPSDVGPKAELIIQRGEPRWRLTVGAKDGKLIGVYLDSELKILYSQYLGSSLENATATLFPEGPILSQLQKVWLSNLSSNRNLLSSLVHVNTQSDQTAIAENSQFIFPPDDRRFEQVQVFFYISKMLAWCEANISLTLPFILQAETSVGFPEKTNTAFYYQHKIYIGDGDDLTFSRIPLDPSIVYHESFHAVIDAVAKLPFEGEGGSINEAFADFLTAVSTGRPNLGEVSYKKAPFKRTIQNAKTLADKNGGLYHDSGIISGLLWSLQETLGRENGTQLAWQILLRLTPDSDFKSFQVELDTVRSKLPEDQQRKVASVMQKRGWIE